MIEDRPYQINIHAQFDRTRERSRSILMVAPTGAGKTIIASAIIKAELKRHASVLVLAHRREIVTQTSEKLRAHGIAHGIIQAGFQPRPLEQVQICSVQTLHRRAFQSENMDLPAADLVIVDECHHAPAQTYQDIIAGYPGATLLGLTATPCRGDGRGLGGIFDTMIECPQVAELIELGYLVRTRNYAPVDPDLKGVETRVGDYVESQLAERMDRPTLIGDIVTHWHRYGERRKTVAFAVNVAHSIHLRDEFVCSGVRAEHIDGDTPKAERDSALARLASGEIELITNCMVLTEGWDLPAVSCCILARPTRKMGLYRQMTGRVLRPAKDKFDAIVLDHSGAVFRHGFVEDFVEWTLDPDSRAVSPTHERREKTEHGSRLLECKQCGAVRVAGEPCSCCGYLPQRPPRAVDFIDGDLGLVDGKRRAKADLADPALRASWHSQLAWIAAERGYKPGWISHKYKEKFNAWPPWGATPMPAEPSPEVRSWVRSRAIAFARRASA